MAALGGSAFAIYDAGTGNIYNFSGTAVTLTLKLNIAASNSPIFPSGIQTTTVTIPPDSRFVRPCPRRS